MYLLSKQIPFTFQLIIMKNLLPVTLFVFLFAACRQGNEEASRNIQLLTDSTVYTNNNMYSDTMSGVQANNENTQKETVVESPSKKSNKVRTVIKYVPVKADPAEKNETSTTQTSPVTTPPVTDNSENTGTETVKTGNQIPDAGTPGEEVKKEKKGWSKAAQGAVIGGAAGAVGGAIISKKKGLGAVIGGVVGAAGGYIIGKNKDKKDTTNKK